MKTAKRLMQCMLIGLLLFTSFTTATKVEAESSSTWKKVDDIAAAAASGKLVAITVTTDNGEGTTYALPTAKTTNTGPVAVVATKNDGDLVIGGIGTEYGWTITSTEGGYSITNSDGDYLYIISNTNNCVRINTEEESSSYARVWTVSSEFDYLSATSDAVRYLGVYTPTNSTYAQDWRCYKNTTSNIKEQVLEFWTFDSETVEPDTPVESVAVDPTELELEVGQSADLTVTVSPENATDKSVIFESSDKTVATVDTAGKVAAVAVGTATITVTSVNNPDATATCDLTVVPSTLVEKDYGLVSLLATGDKVIIYNAKAKQALGNTVSSYKALGVDVEPVEGIITTTNEDIVWTVTVSENTVTFTQGDYTLGGVKSGNYNNIVVSGGEYTAWTLTGPNQSDLSFYMSLDDMPDTRGVVHLNYQSPGFRLYSVQDPSTDQENYSMNFYKEGAEPEVPQPVAVESVSVDPKELELEVGQTAELTVTVLPRDAANKAVTFTSSDATVASVDETGKVTAVAAGTVTITVASTDGSEKTDTCVVTVKEVSLDDKTVLDKFTEAPKDGSTLVIHHLSSDKVLSPVAAVDNYNHPILSGTDAYWIQDKFILTDDMAYMTVALSTEGEYTFTNAEGKYLTSGEGGNSLTFADEATDCSKWTLEDKGNGVWTLMNVGAAYNGNHNQALEYYNGFTTYGVKDTDAFKFDFYGVQAETPDILVESLTLDKETLELEVGK